MLTTIVVSSNYYLGLQASNLNSVLYSCNPARAELVTSHGWMSCNTDDHSLRWTEHQKHGDFLLCCTHGIAHHFCITLAFRWQMGGQLILWKVIPTLWVFHNIWICLWFREGIRVSTTEMPCNMVGATIKAFSHVQSYFSSRALQAFDVDR